MRTFSQFALRYKAERGEKRMRARDSYQLKQAGLSQLEESFFIIDRTAKIVLCHYSHDGKFSVPSHRNLVGQNIMTITALFPVEDLKTKISCALNTGQSLSGECYWKQKEGKWLSYKIKPLLHNNIVTGALVSFMDITEKKLLEQRLIYQEKMAEIGAMVAGIVHEINNPLDILVSGLDCLDLETSAEGKITCAATDIHQIREQALRISQIIKRLLTFFKDQPVDMLPLDLNAILENVLFALKHKHRHKDILFIKELDPSLPPVLGSKIDLERLFTNLLNNAIEAIPEKGVVEIESNLGNSTDRIQVKISDSGRGIPREVKEKIFEPFFSTKTSYSSLGLGLFFCSQIVKMHHGQIEIESELQKGTTVTVTLPCLKEPNQSNGGKQ